MNLAEEEKAAEYVEILGDLKTKGVLTDGEFRQLKALVLETNDHGISTQLLSLLDKFWSQRTKGYLTDDDFDKKKSHLLDSYLRGSVPTSSVSSSCKGKEPTKRKSCSRFEQTKKRVNPTRTAPSRDRSLSGDKTLLRDKERSLSLGGGSVASAGREHAVGAFASPGGESQELANVESGSTEYSSEEEKGIAEQGVLKCFNYAFWAPTHRFDVPGNGYCRADVPLSFVDSTVELLEKSEPRVFPPFVGAVRPLAASKQNYFRQGKMYGKLKKVMIGVGEGGEERVFRATDAEVCRTVMEVADGRLSLEEYIAEVKRIRGRESAIGENDDRESSA